MMKISLVVLILNLLFNYGSTKPAEIIEADLSVSDYEITDAVNYGSNLLPSLDISENVGVMSSNMESMVDMATESLVEAEALISGESSISGDLSMSGESLLGLKSLMSPESIIDNVQSSIYDATSMASNIMEYSSLINNSPFLSDKAQMLRQLTSFSPDQMGMASGLFQMLAGGFISHMQWKLSVIRAAKEHLALAMEALLAGNMDAVRMHVMEAIHTLQAFCPICRALQYALDNDDFTMLSFAGNMGMSILGQMETFADASISD